MNVTAYINKYDIHPADVIKVKKMFGLLDHYVVFMGWHAVTGEPVFAANYDKGPDWLWGSKLYQLIVEYSPKEIRRFTGNEQQRKEALERAQALIGKSNEQYNLLTNNCEHYANWVQYGNPHSQQVQIAGTGAVAGGLGLALYGAQKGSNGLVIGGLLLGLLGAFALGNESND